MELGLTFPLQRFLGIKTPAWGTEPDRRFCWDLHVIRLRGRGCLLAVHCHSRYAFVRWDVPPLQGGHPRPLPRRPGRQPHRRRPLPVPGGGLSGKGRARLPHPHSWPPGGGLPQPGVGGRAGAGPVPGHGTPGPAPCWTAPSTPAPAGAQALRDWGQGWSGYPHRCYERDAGHPPSFLLCFASSAKAVVKAAGHRGNC